MKTYLLTRVLKKVSDPIDSLLTLTGFSAVLLCNESISYALMYTRPDILQGEIWRIITGHFIHLNIMHWGLNAMGVLLALYLFYQVSLRDWAILSLLSSIGISILLLLFDPEVEWYVGFSGVLHAWFAYGGITTMQKKRWLEASIILVFLIVKIIWEQISGASELSQSLIQGSIIVNAHLYGAICGGLYAIKLFIFRHGAQKKGCRSTPLNDEQKFL